MVRKLNENRGDANTISMLFVLMLLLSVLFTVVDAGVYFNNRYVISNAAQNGARTAAIFGGTQPNNISEKYGVNSMDADCSAFGASNPVECLVYNELKDSTQPVNIKVSSIVCGPGKTSKIGDRTYCEIKYTFNGTPGSGLALAKYFGESKVRMTAESEVVHK